jgi:starch synthase
MRVGFITSEVASLAKTGGLADVALALPQALADMGVEISVVMPKYRAVEGKAQMNEVARFSVPIEGIDRTCIAYRGTLPGGRVPVYFLGHDPYFDRPALYGEGAEYEDALERFAFFSRAALQLFAEIEWIPDILHVNDWHASLIPAYLRDGVVPELSDTRTMLTIHNLGYQGVSPWAQAEVTGLSEDALTPYRQGERINLLKGGILGVDLINTVSPSYAQEILHEGAGLEEALRSREKSLFGVLNGVDMRVWNPKTDEHLWARYDVEQPEGKHENRRKLQEALGLNRDPQVPILGAISRLASQKGFDLIMEGFDRMMAMDVQFVLLGTGDAVYEEFFRAAQQTYPGSVASLITFSEEWAHRIEAAVDIFLMPSHYEPCGLNQQYSLLYGTVPVVRATGGLKDTVIELNPDADTGNGFSFTQSTADAFLEAVGRAVRTYKEHPEVWKRMMQRGMSDDRSWRSAAQEYFSLYRRLTA